MTLAVSGAGSGSLFSLGTDWIADTHTAILNSQNSAGLLGMLESAASGSFNSLGQSRANATNFALISQNSVTNAGAFYAHIAGQVQHQRANELLEKAFADLASTQKMVQTKNVLDPFIYFSNGSSLDTNNNILTLPDGKQIDALTGKKYIDPANLIHMANGAYLDTKNNILTMVDGTEVDTVTGLKISVTA